MPRTTKKPKPAAATNGTVAGEILTLAEVAAYLRLSEQAVLSAVSSQGLPGRLIDGEWRFLKAAVAQWLSESRPTAETRKAAQLALAGAWKDDPDIERIVEEAMSRRGREPGPDGTFAGHHPADGGEE